MEFALRAALLAVRLGETLGLSEEQLADVYYVALLRAVGCNADAADVAAWFGDELVAKGRSLPALNSHRLSDQLMFVLQTAGQGQPPLRRFQLLTDMLVRGEKMFKQVLTANCEVAQRLAEPLGLSAGVQESLGLMFERWDGKGSPGRVKGGQIPLPVRIVQLVRDAVLFYELGGVEAVVAMARQRAGRAYDPEIAEKFCERALALVEVLQVESLFEAALAAEPGVPKMLSEAQLDASAKSIAYFVDLKSPYLRKHSTGVAELAAEAARRYGLPEAEVVSLRRAGYLHDLGRTGVSNVIWDKPGPLTEGEWERVRLHAYYTERVLTRARALAPLGHLASMHHERLDGSGYHRGATASQLPVAARILAAADAYHAMTEPRPHRPALSPEAAEEELRQEVRAGRLDGDAVPAVLAAAGHRVRVTRHAWPAALTDREVEVLRLVTQGLTNRQMGEQLYISESTVHHHIQHIYDKTGVSTRPAATLFAMQHDLLL
ncbi:MAG: HD domain-containing protein [Chloroflexi bacterium]|nr:HD domain-containing protein [Chloroflexota bacterium]